MAADEDKCPALRPLTPDDLLRREELGAVRGEGHVFQGPADIRDMWEQIGGWFGEHLPPATGTAQAAR